jgi:hypothetical protein
VASAPPPDLGRFKRIDLARVVVTGSTVIDALLDVVSRHCPYEDPK